MDCKASLSFSVSRSLLKPMSIESVMPSSHLILCRPLLLPPSIVPSIRVFSSESALRIRGPKDWTSSFSISPSSEYSGLISFKIDWFEILVVQGTLKSPELITFKGLTWLRICLQCGRPRFDCWPPGEGDRLPPPAILCGELRQGSLHRLHKIPTGSCLVFPRGSAGKESACSAGDLGSIPGLGRSPGEGIGYRLHCPSLENPTDRGTWPATAHRVTESRTRFK